MANELILGRALDANGYVMPGAKATVYAAGTSTLITVYSNPAGSIAAANPIEADGNGFWPQRYVDVAAKAIITDAANVTVQTLDPAPVSIGTGSAAGEVSFAPTVAVPFTNVQAAVEGVAGSVLSGVAAFGVGITGNAPLLANLDATTLAAGVYRFDGTTTGTFPTGVTAANTGLVEAWRMTGSEAQMELLEITTNRRFRRRLASGSWQPWREDTAVPQGAARGDVIRRGASVWESIALANGQVARSNGTDTVASGLGFTFLGSQATTSGSTWDFTGIPSWATEIMIVFDVFRHTAGFPGVQLRVSGSPVATGYISNVGAIEASAVTGMNSTAGGAFNLFVATAGQGMIGTMHLIRRPGGNIWIMTHTGMRTGTGASTFHGGGRHDGVSGVVDGIRVFVSGGTGNLGGIDVGYR